MATNKLEETFKDAINSLLTIVQVEEKLEETRLKMVEVFHKQVFEAVGREPLPMELDEKNKEFSDWLASEGYKVVSSRVGGIEKGLEFFILEQHDKTFITGCRMEWNLESEDTIHIKFGRFKPKDDKGYQLLKAALQAAVND